MAVFKVPTTQQPSHLVLSNFLGVNLTDTIVPARRTSYYGATPDLRRSPSMMNLVNNNGFLESRTGMCRLVKVGEGPINGVWNVDGNNEVFVVHSGTELYEVDNEFNGVTLVRTGLNNRKSYGTYLNENLLILDGIRALIYHRVNDDWVVDNLDEIGYIPTVSIGLNYDGTGGTLYEPINICSTYMIYSYMSDGEHDTFIIPDGKYSSDTPTVTMINDSGGIEEVNVVSWNNITREIKFANNIPKTPVDGADNVFIKVKATNITCEINKCTFGILYGYEGNNNRVFVSGNNEYPNYDWYCDNTQGVLYFPSTSVAKIGVAPITGYSRVGDGSLATHKSLTDTDCTVYYRTYNKYGNEEVFPLQSGVKNIGCINPYCCVNFMNDPVFLSETGVYSMISSGSTNERFATERSYYAKTGIMSHDLNNAVAHVNKNRYYLLFGDTAYVADKRFASSSEYSDTYDSDYGYSQYEWFLLKFPISVKTMFNWNGKLYFGSENGYLATLKDDYTDIKGLSNNVDRYMDDNFNGGDELSTIRVVYTSPWLDFGTSTHSKTIRRMYTEVPETSGGVSNTLSVIDDQINSRTVTEYTFNNLPSNKITQNKEKLNKIPRCKIMITNNENTKNKVAFSSITIEYKVAGKFRGDDLDGYFQ